MAKFDDLTADQSAFLCVLVRAIDGVDFETLQLFRALGNTSYLIAVGRRTTQTVMDEAPFSDAFYLSLERMGYIDLIRDNGVSLRLTRRAFDFVAYASRGKIGQFWIDLTYDLGHDDTLRSKLIWAIGTVLVADLIALAMKQLGVI